MNNDEAISILQNISNKLGNKLSNSEREALSVAINTLEESKQNQVTRGGLFVPLTEVQAMLMNIQRQL